ncbi:2-polyprenyl-6-methoxyphenol hydroxylase-like FAD-dependent oxidoreductase [Actinocrispum wychmicini]|uniref:2-polyprenyl-6-methoxyphenol hydroxylase-like FAD-dependent oxidoreductase n=1 Tax=Actinocrispum wychmicini TaxID=1213861 RepID=A0A4R2JQE0_9PSEU|nr:2-polyprenyl-6-methoxyphenol hydroxylase-like FAD-dependent oxidoreductase [Actinocrispum wychmicini]
MVGAGPTGLMLAAELALAGVAVRVVERQAEPSGQSRGGGVNARTAEVFAMRGLMADMAARSIRREVVGAHFAGLPVGLDVRPWRTRYPGGALIPQDRIESVLENRLAELGVTVRRATSVVEMDTSDDGVTVTLDDGSSIQGQYLVACDGAHSTIRSLTGAEFPGRPGTMKAVTADIELTARSVTVPTTVEHISRLVKAGGDYWMMLHPLYGPGEENGLYRVVFGGPEQQTLPRSTPVTAEEVSRALVAVHGPDTRIGRLRWGTRFTDATRQLARYRHGRVLFAGDAAHIHSPLGGQGLNLGVQDAMNLGWKLAAHVHGTAPEGLLDTYHDERHPVAARVLTVTQAQRAVMPPRDPDAVALREILTEMVRLPDTNRYLAGLMSGLDIRYPLGSGEPLVGERMPDLSLRLADGTVTQVSALLRPGRAVLLDLAAEGPDVSGVDRVVAEPVPSDIGVETGAAPGVERILIRPDGYVSWVGSGDSMVVPWAETSRLPANTWV